MSALKLTITSWGVVALDKKGLRALMRGAGNDIKSKTARLISRQSGGGRTYAGGGGAAYRGQYRPGPYTASAPGEPPVAVSGSLKGSLRTYAYRDGDGFAVRARQFYALFLEVGAEGGGNPGRGARRAQLRRQRRRSFHSRRSMAPRPFLDRVMAAEEKNLDQRVRKALEQGMTWRQTR